MSASSRDLLRTRLLIINFRHRWCCWYGVLQTFSSRNGLWTYSLAGAIHIKGPSSMNYDVDLGPLLISDWYHADAFSLYQTEIATPEAPLPETNIINGKGVFDCDPATDPRCTGLRQRHEILFQRGTTYKLGLVNTGSLLTYKFWIDGHSFTVIQTDFVPIKPYVTDVLIVGIGSHPNDQKKEKKKKKKKDTATNTL